MPPVRYLIPGDHGCIPRTPDRCLLRIFYIWGPPECTEKPLMNPTNRGGPQFLKMFLFLFVFTPGDHRNGQNESHETRGPPVIFYSWGPPESTEQHRTNPTNRGGTPSYIYFYPWGPPEWTEPSPRTPETPREIFGKFV